MRIATWNVQWCRGLDGRVDPARIAAELRRLGEPEVACLQELACGFAELAGSRGEDQAAALAQALPECDAVVAWAVDLPGAGRARKRFGNLLLSRLPVGRVRRHSLPWPASPEAPTMPRIAVEATVSAPFGPVRVVSTHFEYYSARHRGAQVARLAELHAEWQAQRKDPGEPGPFDADVNHALEGQHERRLVDHDLGRTHADRIGTDFLNPRETADRLLMPLQPGFGEGTPIAHVKA